MSNMQEILEVVKTVCNSLHKLVLTLIRIIRAWLLMTGKCKGSSAARPWWLAEMNY